MKLSSCRLEVLSLAYIWGWTVISIAEAKVSRSKAKRNNPDQSNRLIPGFSCNFDADYCGWQNDTKADFNWVRNRGRTPSDNTGPPWDHTTGDKNDGSYLYIETSSPRKNGDRARLYSPVLAVPGLYCLRLWHHMHGANIRDLNIYIKEDPRKRILTISHLSGAWSTEGSLQRRSFGKERDWWNEHETEFIVTSPVRIIIEGVRGDNFRGDIAIDDITLTSSRCSHKSISCNFENNTCGWVQLSGDEFNWLPNRGLTPTRYTGPSVDHTLGTEDGRYLYVESSWPRVEGDRTRLLSPPITCLPEAHPIFRFWYNMNGVTIGPLRVYAVENKTSVLGDPLWELTGDQGTSWMLADIKIPVKFIRDLDNFYIIIEGEIKEYRGDAAIDDLELIGCDSLNIPPEETTTTTATTTTTTTPETITPPLSDVTTLPGNLNCSFEVHTFCAWRHDHSGQFLWTLNQGKTNSLKTGPIYDHTSKAGWYMYAEASSPRARSDKALLRSPTISSNVHSCLKFYYHMYGETMGKLEILTARAGSQKFSQKWAVEGQQSANQTDWRFAAIDISEDFNYNLVLRAVRGDNFYSDIAVDDITVVSGPCYTASAISSTSLVTTSTTFETTTSPTGPIASSEYDRVNCDFDHHTVCNWNQETNDDFDFTVSLLSSTESHYTGPTNDHSGGGQFAYIEASNPRVENDTAMIESPLFTVTSPVCFSMWYHMNGEDIGSLSIHRTMNKKNPQGKSETKTEEMWKVTKHIGDVWRRVQLNLYEPGDTQIIVEAVRGKGWKGDIAIDDITLTNEECPIFNCTFQTGTCGWIQDAADDDFDWKRQNLRTQTANTGPEHDRTHRNDKGFYYYIETSSPRELGDSARLISPVVTSNSSENKCLRFWYHSFGAHIGSLNVYKRNLDESDPFLGSPLWYQAEDEGDQWLYAQINIEESASYRIIFEGVRGVSYRGDLAIDDVTISDGECTSCCGDQFFKCGNFFCVPATSRCNGIDDCGDGSDESFCQGCGLTSVRPTLSRNYGTIIRIDNTIQRVTTPASPRHSSNGNSNSDRPGPLANRVVQITNDQFQRIKHKGLADLSRLSLNVSGFTTDAEVDQQDSAPQTSFLYKVEIIKLRKRRDLAREIHERAIILSKLLRSYKNSTNATENQLNITAKMPIASRSTSSVDGEKAVENFTTSEISVASSASTTTTVSAATSTVKTTKTSTTIIKPTTTATTASTTAKSTLSTTPAEEEREKSRRHRTRFPNGPIKPHPWFHPIKIYPVRRLVLRKPEQIPWFQMPRFRKPLRRDQEEEEEEEEEGSSGEREERSDASLIRRIKRKVLLKITGGSQARAHSWPWQVAYYISDSTTAEHYFCGATLIDRYWIVTAAHCPHLGDIHSVVVGDHDLYEDEGSEQELKVEAIYVNQDFTFTEDLLGDIALIKLKYPARTSEAVQPACLLQADEKRFEIGHVCAITGWGRTNADDPGVERILLQGETPLLTQEVCRNTYTTRIYDSMFCAGGTGSNTCRGDSGGPLICERNNTAYLVGITSWGDNQCLGDVPGVYMKVQSYVNWIRRIITASETCS